jgi:hypothetical protein
MKKFGLVALITTSLMSTTAFLPMPSAHAQPGGGGGMGRMMRNNPKMRLSVLMRGIGSLERERKTPVSASQARVIVTAVRPWISKPTMSEAQANSLYTRINGVLTSQQKAALQNARGNGRDGNRRGDDDRRGAGQRNGGPGGRDGGRRNAGGRSNSGGERPGGNRPNMQQMQGFFRTYNPFYPPSKYKQLNTLPERMREGMNRRYKTQQTVLNSLAKKAGIKL